MRLTQTYTVVTMEVSDQCFDEIKSLLEKAEYYHCFVDGLINMNGIALKREGNDDERNGP